MKKLPYFILAIFSGLFVGRVCEAQQLTDAENLQVASFSKEINTLQEVFENRLRTKYEISSDEELVCTGFVLSSSDSRYDERNTPVYTFSYGLKSSLVEYEAKSPFGERIAYTRNYTVKVFPNEGTVQFLKIIAQN